MIAIAGAKLLFQSGYHIRWGQVVEMAVIAGDVFEQGRT